MGTSSQVAHNVEKDNEDLGPLSVDQSSTRMFTHLNIIHKRPQPQPRGDPAQLGPSYGLHISSVNPTLNTRKWVTPHLLGLQHQGKCGSCFEEFIIQFRHHTRKWHGFSDCWGRAVVAALESKQ